MPHALRRFNLDKRARFLEIRDMKTTIRLFPIVFAFLSVTISPQARATCQDGCLTDNNTVLGDDALINVTLGIDNTAIGFQALQFDTIGTENTAVGYLTLNQNTSGNANTAMGFDALFSNTNGFANTANGAGALMNNTIGSENTAMGEAALLNSTSGSKNTALGSDALLSNTTGIKNTASGWNALSRNTTGDNNIALGQLAGVNLTTGNGNIDIGNVGVAGEGKTIRIGTTGTQTNTFIAGISGATVPTGVPVIVDTTGHLGTTTSSARYKEAVKPMDKASEAILALKPVTFRYKKQLDPEGIPQFGLVAEQVEKVNPDLVARDEQGKPYTVRYEAVNAMLLNEFLKEHRTVQEQGATITRQRKDFETAIAQQQKQIEALTATVKEQASQIQKVSAQLEASSRSGQQTVVSNP
jgi:hypothetical protein